jgi:hypothetical protein
MIFDAQVQAVGFEVVPATADDEGKIAPDAPVTLVIILGMGFPTPQGIAQLPAGILRIPMSQDAANRYGDALKLGAEGKTPEPEKRDMKSDLIIATGQDDVDQMARQAAQADTLKG